MIWSIHLWNRCGLIILIDLPIGVDRKTDLDFLDFSVLCLPVLCLPVPRLPVSLIEREGMTLGLING